MKIKILLALAAFFFAGLYLSHFAVTSEAQKNLRKGVVSIVTPTPTVVKSITGVEFAGIKWDKVANNSFPMPGGTTTFSSYGQPAVNVRGTVVFRARSTGTQRQTGIYIREYPQGIVRSMADLNAFVPYPNNLDTTFTEFPSIPRIAMNKDITATRGTHKPVYKYLLPDQTETRVGTTGIYSEMTPGNPITAAAKVGAAPGFEYFAVPGRPNVVFDVFPGSPAINDDGTVVFKGNFTVNGIGKTGIFYRNILDTPGGGMSQVEEIASSDTAIPNGPPHKGFWPLRFGSTAPPSVVGNEVVFVGLDNEDDPRYGGIYIAPIQSHPKLRLLIGIGKSVPGTSLPPLTRIGEALAYDGRYLAFWGAWGTAAKTIRLYCAEDGNPDLLAYCNGIDPVSMFDPQTGRWYQEKEVPVNQGIFLYDNLLGVGYLAAGTKGDFNDFVFWGYSGKAPGTGSGDDVDSEPPRWRAASFVGTSEGQVVFKARTGMLDENNLYVNPIDGIYYSDPAVNTSLFALAETGMAGEQIDREIAGALMTVTGLGIEREGFRGKNLVITATMANAEESWAGIYISEISR